MGRIRSFIEGTMEKTSCLDKCNLESIMEIRMNIVRLDGGHQCNPWNFLRIAIQKTLRDLYEARDITLKVV